MSDLVIRNLYEEFGQDRDPALHLGIAHTGDNMFYIFHSQACFDSTPETTDLRDCMYSLALDRGLLPEQIIEDEVVVLSIQDGRLKTNQRRT